MGYIPAKKHNNKPATIQPRTKSQIRALDMAIQSTERRLGMAPRYIHDPDR